VLSLLAELKRRNVFRVAAAYLVVGWSGGPGSGGLGTWCALHVPWGVHYSGLNEVNDLTGPQLKN
jgi:hypothetical protein